jgi:hypothetical protein
MTDAPGKAVHCGHRLDPQESIVWEGAPSWRVLAVRVFHIRLVGAYFVVLEGLGLVGVLRAHAPWAALILPPTIGLAVTGLICLLAIGIARSTRYMITGRRVILRYGVGLPRSLSIPFRQIAEMAVCVRRNQTGDITLKLKPENRIPYLKLWPHARPWTLRRPLPMLRGIAVAGPVATLLSRQLAAFQHLGPHDRDAMAAETAG